MPLDLRPSRMARAGHESAELLLVSPMVISKVILGAAVLSFMATLEIPRGWSGLILLHVLITLPFESCNSRVVAVRVFGTPNGASDGLMARIRIFAGSVPPIMNPPINTLSPVWTKPRVAMFASFAVEADSRS